MTQTLDETITIPKSFTTNDPLDLKKIPHMYGKDTTTLPAGVEIKALGLDLGRQWLEVEVLGAEENAYGWLNLDDLPTLVPALSADDLQHLPRSSYAHNSRQEILALIAAINKKSEADFVASNVIKNATIWCGLLLVGLVLLLGLNNPVAAILPVSVWFFWVLVRRSQFFPGQLTHLRQLQKQKRTSIEVRQDQIQTAKTVAVGGGIALAILALVLKSKANSQARRRVAVAEAKRLEASRQAASQARAAQQAELQRQVEAQQQATAQAEAQQRRQAALAARAQSEWEAEQRWREHEQQRRREEERYAAKRRQWEQDVDIDRMQRGLL